MNGLQLLQDVIAKNNFDDGTMRRLIQVEKELKALEIIKKKQVDIYEITFSFSLIEYNICNSHMRALSQEEYDLLKEVLS